MGAVPTLRCSKVHTLQSGSWTPGYTSTRILANLTRTWSEPPAPPAHIRSAERVGRQVKLPQPTPSTHLESARREAAADLSLARRPGPQRRRDGGPLGAHHRTSTARQHLQCVGDFRDKVSV
jgi:hypothetical protein